MATTKEEIELSNSYLKLALRYEHLAEEEQEQVLALRDLMHEAQGRRKLCLFMATYFRTKARIWWSERPPHKSRKNRGQK